jgi:hypothetical protein
MDATGIEIPRPAASLSRTEALKSLGLNFCNARAKG